MNLPHLNRDTSTVAFLPYESNNAYTIQMRKILEKKYKVVDYKGVKSGEVRLNSIDYIYLNWIENEFEIRDQEILCAAKKKGIKIVWVFHNKVAHDCKDASKSIETIKFIMDLCDFIIIHSVSSKRVLQYYNKNVDDRKIIFIPHINYCGIYDTLGIGLREKFSIKNDELLFGMFGLLRPYKNIELIIELFKNDRRLKQQKIIIMGKCGDQEYFKILKDKVKDCKNIILKNIYISDIAMGGYLEALDVMILPYNVRSSMNSGAMIMGFSYAKTVIIPQIEMSDEYADSLIYKYEYSNDEEHINALRQQIYKAIDSGREENRLKGLQLKELVLKENNIDVVSQKLLGMLGCK